MKIFLDTSILQNLVYVEENPGEESEGSGEECKKIECTDYGCLKYERQDEKKECKRFEGTNFKCLDEHVDPTTQPAHWPRCIHESKVCDNTQDCMKGSDEENCTGLYGLIESKLFKNLIL